MKTKMRKRIQKTCVAPVILIDNDDISYLNIRRRHCILIRRKRSLSELWLLIENQKM